MAEPHLVDVSKWGGLPDIVNQLTSHPGRLVAAVSPAIYIGEPGRGRGYNQPQHPMRRVYQLGARGLGGPCDWIGHE